jgi:hypothetical protein
MSVLKSGAILLLLTIPFVLYAAWQVQTLTRGDLLVSDAPSEKGLPAKEQLADRRTKTEKWVGDVRKASAVALQFRTPKGAIPDPECEAVAAAAARRSDDLTDLDKFLSGRKPEFVGSMAKRYKDWYDETESLRLAAIEVEDWFRRDPVIGSQSTAEAELTRFTQKLDAYTKGNPIFVDRGMVSGWRVRAAAHIVTALAKTVKAPYQRVLDLPLPLPSEGRNMDMKIALGALAEMKAQAERLEKLVAQARTEGVTLPDDAVKARASALETTREWAAADDLLGLFADPELFTEPTKATAWLPEVQKQYDRTQAEAGRQLIRKKVQQFCEAYVPRAARLDPQVIVFQLQDGKLERKVIPRSGVTIEYLGMKPKPLTDLFDQLNEFNFQTQYKNLDSIVWANGAQRTADTSRLRPTPKSVAAHTFSQPRGEVTTWSPTAVKQLKMKCEGLADALQMKEPQLEKLLDELVGAATEGAAGGPAWTEKNTRVWTRLKSLADAMEKHPTLFEPVKTGG